VWFNLLYPATNSRQELLANNTKMIKANKLTEENLAKQKLSPGRPKTVRLPPYDG
jgi:hypothetical protein